MRKHEAKEDPIVDETRRLRDEYAKSFDYDLGKIQQDLMDRHKRLSNKQNTARAQRRKSAGLPVRKAQARRTVAK